MDSYERFIKGCAAKATRFRRERLERERIRTVAKKTAKSLTVKLSREKNNG